MYKNKEDRKKYYLDNKQILSLKSKLYRLKNKEKLQKSKKAYYDKNKEILNKKQYELKKKKLSSDPFFKFKESVRNLIRVSILNTKWKKHSKTQKMLGCSFEELKIHLEATFVKNYGRYRLDSDKVHIDHIIPLNSASNEEEFIKLNHFSNLQYLFALDNILKSNKLDFVLNRG